MRHFETKKRAWLALILCVTLLLAVATGASLWFMLAMPGQSHRGPPAPVSADERILADRLRTHVAAIAGQIHNTENPQALAQAARYIERQLREMDYAVAIQRYPSSGVEVENLEVEIRGATRPREIVVIGAHYDSAPDTQGANDNASGTAMVLELARRFRTSRPERTLRFVLFSNEEPPHFKMPTMGSLVYANRSRARNENIVAMLSLETIGYYTDAPDSQQYPSILKPLFPSTGNFIAFVGDLRSRALVRQSIAAFRSAQDFPSEGLAAPSEIEGVDWSDHGSFWRNGYRALMITDTAIFRYPHYHSAQDTPDKLDYDKMARVAHGVGAVVGALAATPPN